MLKFIYFLLFVGLFFSCKDFQNSKANFESQGKKEEANSNVKNLEHKNLIYIPTELITEKYKTNDIDEIKLQLLQFKGVMDAFYSEDKKLVVIVSDTISKNNLLETIYKSK